MNEVDNSANVSVGAVRELLKRKMPNYHIKLIGYKFNYDKSLRVHIQSCRKGTYFFENEYVVLEKNEYNVMMREIKIKSLLKK